MAQKRTQYVKTSRGLEKQLIASSADIVELEAIEGLEATNVQDALEEINTKSTQGGVTGVKGNAETEYRKGNVNITPANIGLGNVTNDAQVKRSEMGAASGVATLGDDGKVPTSQLPSYVDDVVEYDRKESFPATGESGKIYVAKDTNVTWRWSGSDYIEISASLALGETSSTAYAGNKGKQNADDIAQLKKDVTDNYNSIANITNGTTQVGKSGTADALTTARKISLKGDASGETTFNGSADREIQVTLADSGVVDGTYSAVTVDKKGRVIAGAQLVEWGVSGQTTATENLAIGGLFFELVE